MDNNNKKQLVERDSAIYWAMRIKDPLIRKEAIENIRAQPEWEDKENIKYSPPYVQITYMFDWELTNEGHDYWEDIHDRYSADPSLWSEYPIYDELPEEYYITNPKPGSANHELGNLLDKVGLPGWTDDQRFYIIKGKRIDFSSNSPTDIPEVQYDNWKELVTGKKKEEPVVEEQVQKYEVGDWVCLKPDNLYGIVTSGIKVDTAYKVTKIYSTDCVEIDKAPMEPLSNTRFRPATQEEIDKATSRKKLSFKTEDGYDIYEDNSREEFVWVFYNHEKEEWEADGFECPVVEVHKNQFTAPKHSRVFHNKENAEKWIAEQNRKVEEKKEIVWKVGNVVTIIGTYTVTQVTDTHIWLDGESMWDIKTATQRIKDGTWTMIEKEDTSTVKESIPDREWKVGDKFKYQKNDCIYTIAYVSDNCVTIEWVDDGKLKTVDYSVKEVDKYWNNSWIPHNPEPISVTQENAYVGMKVVRGRDWEWGNGLEQLPIGTIGKIIAVPHKVGGQPRVSVQWIEAEGTKKQNSYDIGIISNLYIAPEDPQIEQIRSKTTIINKQTKTTNNGNNNEESSTKESYTGISLSEEKRPETISTGTYTKGQSLSVHAEPDSISRGKRTTGTSLSCW